MAEIILPKTDFVFDEQTVRRVSHEVWLLRNLVAHKTESGMENPDEFTSDDYVKYFGKTKEYAETMLHILFKGGFLGITTYKEGGVSFRFKVTRFFIKYNESGNPILSNTK